MPNVPSSRGYTGGFAVGQLPQMSNTSCLPFINHVHNQYNLLRPGLMRKDLGLALDAATATHASVPLGGLALQMYNILAKHG
jgi:3-hydroxyisobutyrate dehydrogenase-like beta-hydroxyacid dehydrogenase